MNNIDLMLLLQNVILVLLTVGVPLLILVFLASSMGKWYDAYPDPPPEAFEEAEKHH